MFERKIYDVMLKWKQEYAPKYASVPKESLIILDEIQLFPPARQALKNLLESCRVLRLYLL